MLIDKIITREGLIYFTQQFYNKINNTFAKKSHTHTSLASKVHTHVASEVSLNDGRNLEEVIKNIEDKTLPIQEVILSSDGGKSYKLTIDNTGVLHTIPVDSNTECNTLVIINNFKLSVDENGRLITTKL